MIAQNFVTVYHVVNDRYGVMEWRNSRGYDLSTYESQFEATVAAAGIAAEKRLPLQIAGVVWEVSDPMAPAEMSDAEFDRLLAEEDAKRADARDDERMQRYPTRLALI